MTDLENDKLWDDYLYPGTTVLKNNFGCTDFDELKEKEVSISLKKLLELNDKPLDYGCDAEHLKKIHRYIFEEIYPFAGEYRKVNMRKQIGEFLYIKDDNTINNYLDYLFADVNNQINSCNSKAEFSDALGKLYTGLIFCHPFREGNGRTIREFVREYSIYKSREVLSEEQELDWSLVNSSELNQYLEIAHLYPGMTGMLFLNALVPRKQNKK